jgi:hypothetical protein
MAVNYQMDVIDPFQAALKGYGAGAQMLQQERTAERQVRQDEQQSQLFGLQMQEAQARLQTLNDERAKAQRTQASMAKALEAVQKGEFSSELIAETFTASPEFGKFLQAERDRLNTEQKQNLANQNLEIATAIEMDQIPIAQRLYEEMAVAAENSGKPEDAAAARAMAAQLDKPDGRDVVRTTAYMAAGSVLPPQDFNQRYASIQAMKSAPLKEKQAALEIEQTQAEIDRQRAAASLDRMKAKLEQQTGLKVQSSTIIPNGDGTAISVMSDGSTKVVNPKQEIVTGQAAADAIATANAVAARNVGTTSSSRAAGALNQKLVGEAFTSLGNVRTNIRNLDNVIATLEKPGVSTGVIESQLPTFNVATLELRNLRNTLGLDVISNTTFGALSEGELDLALDTALPTGLSPPQLKKWALDKRAAQQKYADYLSDVVIFLNVPGNTIFEWEKQQRSKQAAAEGTIVPVGAKKKQ